MFLVASWFCLCLIQWSQVLGREWRCSWGSVHGQEKISTQSKWWYLLLWSHSFSKGRFNSLRLTKQFIRHMNASVVQPSAVLPKIEILHMHYFDVIMNTIASQITSLTVVYWIVFSDTDQRKHQSSVLLAFVREIHRSPVNSPHKEPVTRKMFPFDDVIMDKLTECQL